MIKISDIKNFYSTAVDDYEKAKAKISNVDKLESEILHYIEPGNYNAVQGSKLIKKLKEVRRVRRLYKMDFEEVKIVVDRLSKIEINNLKYSPAKCIVKPNQFDNILNARL